MKPQLTLDQLTPCEIECLLCKVAGMTDRETATHLNCAHDTVKGYLRSARQKLYAHDTTHATWMAFFYGYLSPEDVYNVLHADP